MTGIGEEIAMTVFQTGEEKEMMIEGVICLSNGENPRIVEQKLAAFLAPNQRNQEAK